MRGFCWRIMGVTCSDANSPCSDSDALDSARSEPVTPPGDRMNAAAVVVRAPRSNAAGYRPSVPLRFSVAERVEVLKELKELTHVPVRPL